MPDEPRRGGPGPGGDQAPQEDQPTGRRRRSLDAGGLSVSDLLEQHSRTNLPRPVAPGPPDTGRRAAPEPEPPRRPAPPQNGRPAPESTGRRAAPEPPRRQAPPPDYVPPAPEDTGTRPRPTNGAPPVTGRRPAPPSNDYFAPSGEGTGNRTPRPIPEDTGARRRVEEPGQVRPGDAARRPEDGGRRFAEGQRPANGYTGRPDDVPPGRPGAGPRPAPGEVAGEPSRRFPANGRPRTEGGPRRPDDLESPHGPQDPAAVSRRLADNTGQRPRPDLPGSAPGRRPADGSGPRQHPDDLAPDTPRRSADGSGPRQRPDGLVPDVPRRSAEGGAPRQRPEDLVDGPRRADGTGQRPRPDEVGAPGRRVAEGGAAEGIGRRLADGPRPGERPHPGTPADGPHRLADGSGPHDLTDGPRTGRRPRPEDPAADPRRLAEGPRPGVPAEGPPGPRRLAEGPPGAPVDGGSAPRRLAEGPPGAPVDGGGPRPAGDVPGRRFAEDSALVQAPPVIGDRLGGGGPEPRESIDPASLTTEMEAISDDVKKRREVDHTLARFSAVHDELAVQERLRKERRQKLMPWKADHDEDATEYAAPVDSPDEDVPRRRGRTAKHSRIVRAVKGVALTAAVLVFVSTGLGWAAMLYIDNKMTEIEALGTNSAAVHEAEKQLGDENFLIVGSDTRAGSKPEDGVGTAQSEEGARSDVLMLAHIPADRKRMVVVSVPRDLEITRPACEEWDPSTGQYSGNELPAAEGKANEPYAVGGPKCVSKFMTELTGLEINHFISVDFNGFKGMVDAIGTVEVCVSEPMKDDELGVIFDQAGKFQIDGTKALDYVRARKVEGTNKTDFDRVTRQQKFLSALLRKSLSSEILLNPGKLNAFLNAFAASTVGQNIGVKDMLTLAQSLQSLEAGRVSFVTIPHVTGEGETESTDDNVELLKEADTKALFQAIIDGTPLPDEKVDTTPPDPDQSQTTTAAPAGPKPGKIIDHNGLKIQVRNGDPENNNAASRTTGRLRTLGYDVVNSDGAPATDKTVIRYGVGGEDTAATLLSSVPGATLAFDVAMGGAVQLLIGPGWDEEVRAPAAPGTAPGQTAPTVPEVEIVNAAQDPCA